MVSQVYFKVGNHSHFPVIRSGKSFDEVHGDRVPRSNHNGEESVGSEWLVMNGLVLTAGCARSNVVHDESNEAGPVELPSNVSDKSYQYLDVPPDDGHDKSEGCQVRRLDGREHILPLCTGETCRLGIVTMHHPTSRGH